MTVGSWHFNLDPCPCANQEVPRAHAEGTRFLTLRRSREGEGRLLGALVED